MKMGSSWSVIFEWVCPLIFLLLKHLWAFANTVFRQDLERVIKMIT